MSDNAEDVLPQNSIVGTPFVIGPQAAPSPPPARPSSQAQFSSDLEEIGTEEQLAALFGALAAAQAEMQPAEKSKMAQIRGQTAGGKDYSYSYKYADIGDIITAIQAPLGKHGLARFHAPKSIGQSRYVVTTLAHSGGGRLRVMIPMVMEERGARSSAQALSAAITQARRIGLLCVTGVSAEETDNEEESESQEQVFRPQQQSNRGRRDG